MSQAGRGKPNRIPGMSAPNGGSHEVPPDIEWDEDNHPYIYPCSQYIEHASNCLGTEDAIELEFESQVKLLNESRAWQRAGMNFTGIPANFPGNGIPIELVDLLIWIEVQKEILLELAGVDIIEYEERFRAKKLLMLETIRERHETQARRKRVADQFGIVESPGLLGPDGRPIG